MSSEERLLSFDEFMEEARKEALAKPAPSSLDERLNWWNQLLNKLWERSDEMRSPES